MTTAHHEITSILNDIVDDIVMADSFDMTIDEMYTMFDEINNREEEQDEECEEWPFSFSYGNYVDECSEESMY